MTEATEEETIQAFLEAMPGFKDCDTEPAWHLAKALKNLRRAEEDLCAAVELLRSSA